MLGALLQVESRTAEGAAAWTVSKGAWHEVREEAAGLLLLAIRRDGHLSAASAAALNVLNKPQVIEKYTLKGNRWTLAEMCRDPAVVTARKDLDGDGPGSTGEWLRSLADALDAPADERPWHQSTVALLIVGLAVLFVLVHVLLLGRTLYKVHSADSMVLLYPLAGIGASAAVGAFAVGVHHLSNPPPKRD